jgi:hypothetical protein
VRSLGISALQGGEVQRKDCIFRQLGAVELYSARPGLKAPGPRTYVLSTLDLQKQPGRELIADSGQLLSCGPDHIWFDAV